MFFYAHSYITPLKLSACVSTLLTLKPVPLTKYQKPQKSFNSGGGMYFYQTLMIIRRKAAVILTNKSYNKNKEMKIQPQILNFQFSIFNEFYHLWAIFV
jgi:hypothetical protein